MGQNLINYSVTFLLVGVDWGHNLGCSHGLSLLHQVGQLQPHCHLPVDFGDDPMSASCSLVPVFSEMKINVLAINFVKRPTVLASMLILVSSS